MYWYEWLILMERELAKKGHILSCIPEQCNGVNEKYLDDWIWKIWKLILSQVEKTNNVIKKSVRTLFQIYKWKFTKSAKRKKKYLLFTAFCLLSENINWRCKVIQKPITRIQVISQINFFYSDINSNTPDMGINAIDYYRLVAPNILKKGKSILNNQNDYLLEKTLTRGRRTEKNTKGGNGGKGKTKRKKQTNDRDNKTRRDKLDFFLNAGMPTSQPLKSIFKEIRDRDSDPNSYSDTKTIRF